MGQQDFGIYIHIPFCQKKCNYCDFPSWPGMEKYWGAYINAAVNELLFKAEKYKNPGIKSIFIGGGTPSLIPHRYISTILCTVYDNYKVSDDCEISMESNPGTLDGKKLAAYMSSGINRLSIGLQACQNHILKELGRIHTFEDFESALILAREHGFVNINADIIFGIPGQTFKEWQETVEKMISFNLPHISCYSLMIEEETVFGRMKAEGILTEMDDEPDRDMYHYAVDKFKEAGYEHYEISNFAKPQYICKHNMNYWERGSYIGIGAGAHSFINGRRFANTKDVIRYMKCINEKIPELTEDSQLSMEEEISEKIILALRLNKGCDLAEVSAEFNVDAEEKYKKNIDLLLSRKLISREGDIIKLTKLGLDLANGVFVEFI